MNRKNIILGLQLLMPLLALFPGEEPELTLTWGSFRTPYAYLMSEAEATLPRFILGGVVWEAEGRLRAYGSYYFFSTASLDGEITLGLPISLGKGMVLKPLVGLEWDYRNADSLRNTAVTSLVPLAGVEGRGDLGPLRIATQLESRIYQDGFGLRFVPVLGYRGWKPLTILIKAEILYLTSFPRNLTELRGNTFAGLGWIF